MASGRSEARTAPRSPRSWPSPGRRLPPESARSRKRRKQEAAGRRMRRGRHRCRMVQCIHERSRRDHHEDKAGQHDGRREDPAPLALFALLPGSGPAGSTGDGALGGCRLAGLFPVCRRVGVDAGLRFQSVRSGEFRPAPLPRLLRPTSRSGPLRARIPALARSPATLGSASGSGSGSNAAPGALVCCSDEEGCRLRFGLRLGCRRRLRLHRPRRLFALELFFHLEVGQPVRVGLEAPARRGPSRAPPLRAPIRWRPPSPPTGA